MEISSPGLCRVDSVALRSTEIPPLLRFHPPEVPPPDLLEFPCLELATLPGRTNQQVIETMVFFQCGLPVLFIRGSLPHKVFTDGRRRGDSSVWFHHLYNLLGYVGVPPAITSSIWELPVDKRRQERLVSQRTPPSCKPTTKKGADGNFSPSISGRFFKGGFV